ncbi:hypothetical protein DPMN_162873 [Dreissena polymorpha]|uniref:Uncharacterized protein n=1 Tax=Dreissena polymorpha TaxID=45954 RepID=A0A9D4EVQ0_DREPO|nr:hypothetical protein DPMN_162873 [Dreissena polymorpha]
MVPDNIPDRRGTSRRLSDNLRRCQDRQGTCRRLQDGAKNSPRPSGHLNRHSDSLRRCQDCPGTSRRLPDRFPDRWGICRDSKTVFDGAKTVRAPAGDFQTVFNGVRDCLALLQTVWESPEVAQIVLARRRMYGSL